MQSNRLIEATSTAIHWLLIPLVAALIILWPTFLSGLGMLQTDPGDTLLNHYFLEHAYQHVRDAQLLNPDHFWSPDYFWPVKDTLAWSDHLIGPAVIYGAIRIILRDPHQAYVGWLTLTLGLNYISLRRALMHISPATSSAWLSLIALITAFSPAITTQLGHPQLLSLFLLGPILVLCHRLLTDEQPESFSINDWLMLGFWLLSNGIFNIYIFVYACYGSLICTIIHLIRRTLRRQWLIEIGQQWKRSVACLLAVIAANGIIYRPYLDSLETFGKRSSEEIVRNLPKPASWLFSNDHWLLPPLLSPGQSPEGWVYGVEQELFPGWLFLILFAAAVITALSQRSRGDRELRLWLIAVAGMLLGSLSIMDLSLWPWISKILPGASSLRASSRVGLIIVLYAAPCLALASRHWIGLRTVAGKTVTVLVGFAAAFLSILAVSQPSFSLNEWKKEYRGISQALLEENCDVFWKQWSDEPPFRAHVQAMHIQQNTGIPTLNGLSGNFPKHDWPYTRPSGDGAYAWIALFNPGQHHRVREQSDSLTRCVVSWDSSNGSANVRSVEVQNGLPLSISEGFQPARIIFQENGIEFATAENDWLWARFIATENNSVSDNWIMLTRDGRPISATRGDYSITGATRQGRYLLVDDTNTKKKLQYTWKIDAKTGTFISQTKHRLGD